MRNADCNEHCNECECLRFRDSWSAGSIYKPGDAVPYEGSSYVAIHLNQNDPPPSGNWAMIASVGPAGQAGAAGETGPQGPAGGGSTLFAFAPSDQLPDTDLGTDGQVIAVLQVPAGSYLITGSIGFSNEDTDDQNWTFEVDFPSGPVYTLTGRAAGTGGGGLAITGDIIAASMSIVANGTMLQDGPITLRGYGYSIHVDPSNVQFTALQVGRIVSQGGAANP
jgi:hypothetical protein